MEEIESPFTQKWLIIEMFDDDIPRRWMCVGTYDWNGQMWLGLSKFMIDKRLDEPALIPLDRMKSIKFDPEPPKLQEAKIIPLFGAESSRRKRT